MIGMFIVEAVERHVVRDPLPNSASPVVVEHGVESESRALALSPASMKAMGFEISFAFPYGMFVLILLI